MKRALDVMVVEGIQTDDSAAPKIMDDRRFRQGDIGTDFMEYFSGAQRRRSARKRAENRRAAVAV
jgi:biotin carboxylase